MLLLRRLLAHHRSALCPLLRGAVSLPHVCSPHNPHAAPWPPSAHSFPSSDFIKDSRRSFAKGRKSRDDDDASTARVEDIGPVVKSTAVSQMEAAIDALSRELVKLRTGRASPGMLDHIIVETSGVKMALNHLALVTVIDSKTLSITAYDPQVTMLSPRSVNSVLT
uniref:Ribosome-recycling factor, chloroplastic n=1 Tax=Opuntia streptacantha TaxID=393608 RepID=A0A7C8ZUM7_OPUST